MAWRVCSLNSNLTGRPVFFCRTVARSAVYPASGDVLDPDSDDITATKLAVDCQIEHGEVANAAFDLRASSGLTRRVLVAAGALPRSACPCSRATIYAASGWSSFDSAWVILLGYRGRELVPMVRHR
jgi:hypothetical protein